MAQEARHGCGIVPGMSRVRLCILVSMHHNVCTGAPRVRRHVTRCQQLIISKTGAKSAMGWLQVPLSAALRPCAESASAHVDGMCKNARNTSRLPRCRQACAV